MLHGLELHKNSGYTYTPAEHNMVSDKIKLNQTQYNYLVKSIKIKKYKEGRYGGTVDLFFGKYLGNPVIGSMWKSGKEAYNELKLRIDNNYVLSSN